MHIMTVIHRPLVSVVMVIRDVERYLTEAIESILNQTFRDFEFIIVDFGSTDRSKDIVATYAAKDSRVRFSEIPPCSYIEAKIAACALPESRYIAIQDADDVSLSERLQLEVDFLERHPEVGFVGGAVQWIDSEGRVLATEDDYPTEDVDIRSELRVRNTFWHPTVLILKEAFVRAGGYRAAFTQSDDYDLWLRIAENYQCANLKETVLNYRVHPQQLSVRKRKDQILCALAARAAASMRSEGKSDPLNAAKGITPAVLAAMGVDEAAQKKELVKNYCAYIEHMFVVGGYSAVPDAITEMLEVCDGSSLESRLVFDMNILSAKALWRQGKVMGSLLSVARAARSRPRRLARPLRELLRRFNRRS